MAYQCEKNSNQDIVLSQEDSLLEKPTVYHIFGVSKPLNRCVLSEDDFLKYIHCLQDTNTTPYQLRQYLKDKYLLTIGCDIPDWTFRLLLYSLKETDDSIGARGGSRDSFHGGAINPQFDDGFVSYLERIKYYSDNRLYEFLAAVTNCLPNEERPSIFLSICSEEYESIGKILKRKLSSRFNVWYCDDNLNGHGGEAYWSEIRKGLEQCRYFMPVITPRACVKLLRSSDVIEPRHDEEGGIITEWKYALDVWRRNYAPNGEKYCIPYRIDVDLNDFKRDLQSKFGGILFDLFFSDSGNQHIENVLPKDFSPEDLDL